MWKKVSENYDIINARGFLKAIMKAPGHCSSINPIFFFFIELGAYATTKDNAE